MNVLHPHTIVNLSSQEKIVCHLPKSEIDIEFTPVQVDPNHWHIVLKVIHLSRSDLTSSPQVIEYDCKDFNRHHIGYYKDDGEINRYHVINLIPFLKDEEVAFPKDTALIWFQMAKNGLEVRSEIKCEIKRN